MLVQLVDNDGDTVVINTEYIAVINPDMVLMLDGVRVRCRGIGPVLVEALTSGPAPAERLKVISSKSAGPGRV